MATSYQSAVNRGPKHVMAAATAALFFFVAQSTAQVSPNAAVAGLTPEFVDAGGVLTRYYDYGDGEAIVMVHGGGRGTTSSANNFSKNIRGLAERFRAIAVDKLGAGMTGNPLEDRDLTNEELGNHLYDFVQALNLSQVHLVGHSSGNAAVLQMAAIHPEVVKTVTFVAHGGVTTHATEGPYMHDLREEATCAEPQTTYTGRKCRLELLGHTPTTFDEEFLLADKWMADQPKSAEMRERVAAARARSQRGQPQAPGLSRQELAARLQMPILYYTAKQDTLSWDADDPHAMMRDELNFFDTLGRDNPKVKMILINEAGHFPYRDHPEQFNADLMHFIDFWNNNPQLLQNDSR